MRDFFLSEILLLSQKQRAAKRVSFDRSTTVILGSNDTGKSVLLKSIYWTFGAEPAVIHPRWRTAEPTVLVRFRIDEIPYQLLRREGFFALYSGEGELLNTYTSITSGLGPELARLLDFGLRLPNRENVSQSPPPAFLFLPFYIDQDRSWVSNWSGFSRLGQFPRWKKPTVEYHVGLRDNAHYEISARIHETRAELDAIEAQLNALQSVLRDFREETVSHGISINLEIFRSEITELLEELSRLRQVEERLKNTLEGLYNDRAVLAAQITIVDRAVKELAKDFSFVSEQTQSDEIACPTCGAEYQNGFADRFAIAEDEDRLSDFLADLVGRRTDIEEEIAATKSQFSSQRDDVQRLQRLLETRQGDITLQELLKAQGRIEFRESFRQRMTAAYEVVMTLQREESLLKARLKENAEALQERRDTILESYQSLMLRYASDLNVQTLSDRVYAHPDVNVPETGSDLPRALMAYYYAVLHVMRQWSPSAYCPIVIDSPNQQGQDQENLVALLEFIRDRQPRGSQLILGVEDLRGVEFAGKLVELKAPLQLLQPGEYDRVAKEVFPLLRQGFALEL
jgi:hypothetical protein